MPNPHKTRLVVAFAALSAALLPLAGCGAKKDARGAREAQPVKVTLVKPVVRPVQRTVDVVGTLFGQEEVTISAKVPGRIERVDKDVQDAAAAGQPLAQVEQTDYRLAVRQKELSIRDPLARLGLSEMPGEDFKPEKVPTAIRARFQADNAKAKYERAEQLHKQTPPLISDQDYADIRTAWDVAESNYRVELLSIDSTLAQIAERQADLDVARQRLNDTVLRAPEPTTQPEPTTRPAPAAGAIAAPKAYYVTQRLVTVGDYVKEGTPLYKLVADDLLKLRAAVPERYANVLSDSMEQARTQSRQVTVDVSVAAFPDKLFPGSVSRINPQVDPASRTFQIEVLIPNPSRQLKSGAFARASIHVRNDPNVIFVPQAAVVTFAGENKLFRVKDNKAIQLSVETGERWIDPTAPSADLREWVEAIGLTAAEPVVLKGANKLAQDVAVSVDRPTSKPATATAKATGDD